MLRSSKRTLAIAFAAFVVTASALDAAPLGETLIEELRASLVRGRYAEVEGEAREALVTLRRNGDAPSLSTAELLDVLVVALWRGGRASHQDAVAFADHAISIKERLLGRDDPALATSLDNAGVLHFVRGDYERALPLYERALAISAAAAAKDPRHRADLGKVHSHLGPLFQELGQYSTARHHYEQALDVFLRSAAPDETHIAMSRNNLATLMTRIGDY